MSNRRKTIYKNDIEQYIINAEKKNKKYLQRKIAIYNQFKNVKVTNVLF